MNHNPLRIVSLLLISLMFGSMFLVTTASIPNAVVTVGLIDPSLGYDEILNGTTIFRVPRHRPVEHRVFYHNVTKFEYKISRVETSEQMPGSFYDNSTGKYYRDTFIAEPYNVSVPDPSGRVTVFSNVVFQNTGLDGPKYKAILHPDGTSQSILHVRGQASGDPSARNLRVTVSNSKYPSGYEVDYTVVQSPFDKSYDVTSIVVGRDINTVSIALETNADKWDVQSYFSVSTVGTDVYIVMIPDKLTSWVSSMDAIRRGVEASCIVKPLVHLSGFKGLTYLEVIDMDTYKYIIEYPENVRPPGFYGESGIIVVNAHGEVFPLPSGISWESWVDTISLAVQTKGLTWVQVAGWPFYYYSGGSYSITTIGAPGFQRFLQPVLGSNAIECLHNQWGYAVPVAEDYTHRLWGYGLFTGGLHEGRPLKISSSTNLADLLKVMWYESSGIKYVTLGLIGFAFPNENLRLHDQLAGYYVHNGAIDTDSDYNKGKYSMAVAAWPKISVLARDYFEIWLIAECYNPQCLGEVRTQVTWISAEPPSVSHENQWMVSFVTTTMGYVDRVILGALPLCNPTQIYDAWAILKVTRTSPSTTFQFIATKSTTIYDTSQTSWQSTLAGVGFWTGIQVLLIPVTCGWSIWSQILLELALGGIEAVVEVGRTIDGSPYSQSGESVNLLMEDLSNVVLQYNGDEYLQLQSYGTTDAYLQQNANQGASETLEFTLGQAVEYWDGGTFSYQMGTSAISIIVEPYTTPGANNNPDTPPIPSGPQAGYRYIWYTYQACTEDSDGDDVKYSFDWGDGTPPTLTDWVASGTTVSASHAWSSLGTYHVKVHAQDSNGAWCDPPQTSLPVNIANRLPNTPSTPDGPTSGYTGVSYGYITSGSDPDGDSVRFQFDWGDTTNIMTDWSSGQLVVAYHSWSDPGTYQVQVQAQDTYGDWSDPSPALTVSLSRPTTRYMTTEGHTVNGLTTAKLSAVQSGTSVSTGVSGAPYWGIKVWIRHTDGTETEIRPDEGVKAVVYGGSTGLKSATWTCPETSLVSTDAVVVRVYVNNQGAWYQPYPSPVFITEQLHATKLNSATWTVYYYNSYSVYSGSCGSYSYGKFWWGSSSYNSRIENLLSA